MSRGKRNPSARRADQNPVLAALRGFGNTASLGVDKYAGAGLLTLALQAQQLAGGDTNLSFKDAYQLALDTIRDQERRDTEEFGKARIAGQIGGGVVNAIATGGAGVLGSIGRGAAQGATMGFTSNEGMEGALQDTLKGAALGGALSGVGGAVAKGQEVAAKAILRSRNTQLIDEQLLRASDEFRALAPAFQAAVAAGKVPNTVQGQVDFVRSAAVGTRSRMGNLPPDVVATAREARKYINSAKGYNRTIERVDTLKGQEALNAVKRIPGQDFMNLVRGTAPIIKESLPAAAGGYALGAGYGLLGDGDWQTTANQGALLLGGGRLALHSGRLKLGAAKALPAYIPHGTGETLARAATIPGVQMLTARPQSSAAGDDFGFTPDVDDDLGFMPEADDDFGFVPEQPTR